MTYEIARIVGSILRSEQMFVVSSGKVWLPFQKDIYDLERHIARALTLHGYYATPANNRIFCGLNIDTDAEDITADELQQALWDSYGYYGRIAGFPTIEEHTVTIEAFEPGNVIEIPALGWVGNEARVVVGHSDGICLAKVNTKEVEVYNGQELEFVNSARDTGKATLPQLAADNKIIVRYLEWSAYGQHVY